MATELSKDDLRRFARLGAIKRLDDMRREEAAIRASFPELFATDRPARPGKSATSSRTRSTRATAADADTAATAAPARKRSTMSPAMRKVVSARMKKYWAGRRKAKNG